MTDTIRERIMTAVAASFSSIVKDEPVGANAYTFAWSLVTREPIGALVRGKKYAIGIYDIEEREDVTTHPLTNLSLRIAFEFHILVSGTESAASLLNLALGEVKRRIREDQTWGGLALSTYSVGNEFDIDGPFDKQVSGTLFAELRYRHNIDDPRAAI